jgi:hypothetical protein
MLIPFGLKVKSHLSVIGGVAFSLILTGPGFSDIAVDVKKTSPFFSKGLNLSREWIIKYQLR